MTVPDTALVPARRVQRADAEIHPGLTTGTSSSKGGGRASVRLNRTPRTSGLTRLPDRRPDHRVLHAIEHADDDGSVPAILRRWRAGDDLAFAELYIHFFARVERYLAIAMKNRDDAAEAAQQVFLKVLEALPRYDASQGEFRDWLFHIVRNQAIDFHRRGHRARPTDPDAVARRQDGEALRFPVARRDEGIGSLIEALPVPQQRILTLRYVYDYRFGEIADVVGMTPEAVRRAHMRALRSLAQPPPTAA